MAYTPGFEYDIFISYSRDDNAVMPWEEQGWVTAFKQGLELWLVKRRHLKGLTIFFDDQNLDGNSDFNTKIKSSIEHSALFFILNSRNYQNSDYCRKELDWFLELNATRPGGIMVGDAMRPFNILLNNIHYTEWPEVLQEKMCFHLHDADPKESGFGSRLDMKSTAFQHCMHDLVAATVKTLDALTQRQPQAPSIKNEEKTEDNTKPIVFLADVADTLKPFRERLKREIEPAAMVLPMLPPPYDAEPHQEELQGALQQASLSIHLLDQWAGSVCATPQTTTFPRLHAEQAFQAQPDTVLWVPDFIDKTDFEDDVQKQWLHDLEYNRDPEHDYQFVRSSKQALIDQIRQMLDTLKRQQITVSTQTRFMIDTHQKDQRYAYKLAGVLADYEIDVDFNKESDNPVDNLEAFDQAVRDVEHLIITFGQVTPEWLKRRLERAMQVQIEQFTHDKNSATLWVFLPPGFQEEGLPKLPPNIKIHYLRCAGKEIDDSVVRPLLDGQEAVA